MTYVLITKDGHLYTNPRTFKREFDTLRGAVVSQTSLRKRGVVVDPVTMETYLANRPMKTVRSMMSGQEITIPADTPSYCDPSCESYWSM